MSSLDQLFHLINFTLALPLTPFLPSPLPKSFVSSKNLNPPLRLHLHFPIKSCSAVFSELFANLTNLSISESIFPSKFKLGQVIPFLKKPGPDKDTSANYRPLFNIINISRMIERLILKHTQLHNSSSSNFNPFQLAYRRYCSTVSALLLAVDNIYPLLTQAHQQYSYHWILLLHLTQLNIPSFSTG